MPKKPQISEATQAKLKDAFWSLYAQKSIDRISIREITDLAGYNRGTFYLYYKNVHNILDQIEKDLIQEIRSLYEGKDIDDLLKDEEHVKMLITNIIRIANKQKKYLRVLFSRYGDPSFIFTLKKELKLFLKDKLTSDFSANPTLHDYYLEYHVSGLLWLIGEWINREDISIEQFLTVLFSILAPKAYQELYPYPLHPANDTPYPE